MVIAHKFNIGDNVTVIDKHTSLGVIAWPCYVKDIDGDYYIMKRRDVFNSNIFRVGKYYPHMIKE
jgi:hypothetical protein